jgi:acyl-CoA reductase-like NAD-dependent aldehyde dehydrogenase
MSAQLDLLLLVADTVAVLADDAGKVGDAAHIRELMQQAEEVSAEIAAVSFDQRAELINELADAMNDRNDVDVGFHQFAEAAVELMEKRGLLRFETAP